LAFAHAGDDFSGPLYSFGDFRRLADAHPLRRMIGANECHTLDGRLYVVLGKARRDDFGAHAPAYAPLAGCATLTGKMSDPQRKARAEYQAQEEARRREAQDRAAEGMDFHIRRLEARVAGLESKQPK
jgi:hypothetical protein